MYFQERAEYTGLQKKCCEDMIREYHKQFKLDFTIVRCGSVYGKGANKYNFIYSLIKSEIKKLETPKGNPKDLREYIHVKDVAKGVVKILDKKYKNKSVLLSGLAPVSTLVLYKTIREILGKKNGNSFMDEKRTGHYNMTPYSYDEIENEKLVLDSYVDFGAGLLEMVKDVKRGRNSRINTN